MRAFKLCDEYFGDKLMKRIISIIVLSIICITGCAGGVVNYKNAKPDDDISESMLNSIGDDLWYLWKEEIPNEGTKYVYLVRKSDDLALRTFVDGVSLLDAADEGRAILAVHQEISNGELCTLFFLSNYDCWGDKDSEILNDFGYLKIRYNEYSDAAWQSPETYTAFEGIRHLEIPDVLQAKADEEGIDWYEIWPELEEIIVFETDK